MKTNQEIFDYVCSKLLLQGNKCSDENFGCRYRGANDTKCAAGWLIDDEVYTRSLEGCTASEYPVWLALQASGVDMDNANTRNLVLALQSSHDFAPEDESFIEWFHKDARRVANMFGLSTAVLDPSAA